MEKNKNAEYFKADAALRHVLGEFQQFLFLGKPPYVRYLCRGLVVPLPGGGILLRLRCAGRKPFWHQHRENHYGAGLPGGNGV